MNRKIQDSDSTDKKIDWMITIVPLISIVILCILFFCCRNDQIIF